MIHSKLHTWNISHKRVFLRVDLNVGLKEGKITNDFRLKSIRETLDFLLKHNNMVILATHIGRPKQYDSTLSTEHLLPWFKKYHYSIQHCSTILDVLMQPFKAQHILLMENLRFFPGEQSGDSFFARQLAQTAHYYVNDAFGSIHRSDSSVSLLPYEFSENRRTIGFLVEKEQMMLKSLLKEPEQPFIAVLGGKKIKEKIPLIKNMAQTVNKIAICPALCFSFLKAFNQEVGKSLVDTSSLPLCAQIVRSADNKQFELLFPKDYLVSGHTVNQKIFYVTENNFTPDMVGIAIGPKTVTKLCTEIEHAQTIFFNCAMGFADIPETQQSTYKLLHALSQAKGSTIVAGGDSIEAVFKAGVAHSIDHISTGGGAALAYLGGSPLPGLIPFEEE